MIILGISGSIAAYKSIDLAKLLLENGYEFKIVLTKAAAEFVSPLTLKSLFPGKIYLHDELLDEKDEMLHISLAKEANMILIAPASANTISKLIYAQADCLLSTICLATEAPIIVAPAMNKVMWENKFVQENIDKLNYIIGPAAGKQACGDEGFGRMLEPFEIIEHIKYFNIDKSLKKKKILITAGPTLERIDPVRFLSNDSSGKMGYALAKMASLMGAEVTLISGPTNLTAHTGIKLIQIESADEMLKETLEQAKHADIFISNAAVADYKPLINHEEKIKKTSNNMTLELTHNPDILSQVKTSFPNIFAVGFAAETNNIKEYGLNKLKQKKLDMIAINDVSNGKAFSQDKNELHVICKDKKDYFIERDNKEVVAEKLLDLISKAI